MANHLDKTYLQVVQMIFHEPISGRKKRKKEYALMISFKHINIYKMKLNTHLK